MWMIQYAAAMSESGSAYRRLGARALPPGRFALLTKPWSAVNARMYQHHEDSVVPWWDVSPDDKVLYGSMVVCRSPT